MRKKYRKPCHLRGITCARDFKNAWDKYIGKKIDFRKRRIEKVRIQEVYIILHGSIKGPIGNATGFMYLSENSKIIAREEKYFNKEIKYNSSKDVVVSTLKRKVVRKITFSCCNTANPDCYNIAQAFIKKMHVRTVVGFDGGALFDYSDKN